MKKSSANMYFCLSLDSEIKMGFLKWSTYLMTLIDGVREANNILSLRNNETKCSFVSKWVGGRVWVCVCMCVAVSATGETHKHPKHYQHQEATCVKYKPKIHKRHLVGCQTHKCKTNLQINTISDACEYN